MLGFHPNDPLQCPRLDACPHRWGASLERGVSAANLETALWTFVRRGNRADQQCG